MLITTHYLIYYFKYTFYDWLKFIWKPHRFHPIIKSVLERVY